MNCSASESGDSKRLSWGRVVQKLLDFNHVADATSIDSSEKRDSECSSVVSIEDPFEEALCAETLDNLSEILGEASARALGWSRLLVPHQLLEHIRQELLHLAAGEPCGLRGALIDLCIENGESYQNVGQLSVDHCTVPTFHVTFLLRPDLGGLWPKFTRRLSNSIRLSTGFTAVKRKLYSSAEVYIEEL
ncbi:DNA damage-inducible transcript 4 protein-like [Colossoma macropomum]|uniref:DNA damage-inducible transcript 4 protein-like n=1 Tax=Colossoma macropomum TaxID=42526 RepID=UPI001863A9B6|nr:DNA damage-inducible transcript 4 protein-like [Colossoma macropomum]